MANQAIALQARAPQGNFLAPAIQQGAQMINMMRQQQALDRQTAVAQQQMELARAGEAREAALAPSRQSKAEADAGAAKVKYASDFKVMSALALANARDPQQAAAEGNRLKQMFPTPEFQQTVDETVAYLTQDPAQFDARRYDTLKRTMATTNQLERQLIQQNLGTSTRVLSVPKYGGGAGEVVPGSEVNLGQEVTYVKGPNGEVIPMPKRTAPAGGGLVGGDRGGGPLGAGIEQAAQQLSPGVVVSGRARTPERNAQVGGVPDSYHMTDNARDFQPAKGQTVAALAKRLEPLKAQGYDVIAEGDHVHVEPGPRMGRTAAPAAGRGVQFGVPVQGTTGGKVDQQKLIKATTAAEAASVRYDRTIEAAQKLLKSPALDSIVGNFQGNLPETALGMMSQGSANALALLNTLIARGGFAELQTMRDASPTGGALGQISDRENTLLQNAAATLVRSQDEASFRENLKSYITELTKSKERVQSAWQEQFGRPFPVSKPAQADKAPAAKTPAATSTASGVKVSDW